MEANRAGVSLVNLHHRVIHVPLGTTRQMKIHLHKRNQQRRSRNQDRRETFYRRGTAQRCRNQRIGISLAKAQRPQRKNNIVIRTWRSSRLGEKNIRSRDVSCIGKFAQAAQTVNDSSTEFGEIGVFFLQEFFTSALSAVMRKNSKTIRTANLASMKSNTCNC